jgi:hypothetical protein
MLKNAPLPEQRSVSKGVLIRVGLLDWLLIQSPERTICKSTGWNKMEPWGKEVSFNAPLPEQP